MDSDFAKYIKKDISDCSSRLPTFDRNIREQNMSGIDKDMLLLTSAVSQAGLIAHILRAVDDAQYHGLLNKFQQQITNISDKYGTNDELNKLSSKITELDKSDFSKETIKLQNKLATINEADKTVLKQEVSQFTKVAEGLYSQDEKVISDVIKFKIAQRYVSDPEKQKKFMKYLDNVQELWEPTKNYQGKVGEYINTGSTKNSSEPLKDFVLDIIDAHKIQDEQKLNDKLKKVITNPENKIVGHYLAKERPEILKTTLNSLNNNELLKVNSIYTDDKNVKKEISDRTSLVKNIFRSIINLDSKYIKNALELKEQIQNQAAKALDIKKLKSSDAYKMSEIITKLDKSMKSSSKNSFDVTPTPTPRNLSNEKEKHRST